MPTSFGDFVVPLIHNHGCIDHIYIYKDSDDEESTDWMNDYPKIQDTTTSIESLAQKIEEDINSIMKRPSHWSRSKELLTELCSQTTQTNVSIPINDTLEDDLNILRIIILHLDERQPFHLSHNKIKIDEFYNINQCMSSIEADISTAVFLIISSSRPVDILPIAKLNVVHAIYIVTDIKSNEDIQTMSTCSKLSGIFNLNEHLLEQLTTDICFYRQIRARTPNMSVFKVEPNILSKLTKHQTDFLCFQLFSGILPQLSAQLTDTVDSDTRNRDELLSRLIEANITISHLFGQFNTSTLKESVTKLNDINQNIVSLAKNVDSSSITVYRAQVVTQDDLKMIQNNSNALLAIQTFVLASRSFQSTANICRRAVNNQLDVVLFELKLTDKASVMDLDSDTVVFSLGTLFRLVSTTDSAPDGVWRAQLESADGTMQRISDQLRFEIGGHLTWLTFGNYLTAFKRFDEAKNYYEYLLLVLPSDHPSLASIYNNMGLMYSEMNEDKTALTLFKEASKFPITGLPIDMDQKGLSISGVLSPESSSINNMTILHKIAEISYRQGNKKTALEYYRRALDIAIDPASCQFYQSKINEILSSDDIQKT